MYIHLIHDLMSKCMYMCLRLCSQNAVSVCVCVCVCVCVWCFVWATLCEIDGLVYRQSKQIDYYYTSLLIIMQINTHTLVLVLYYPVNPTCTCISSFWASLPNKLHNIMTVMIFIFIHTYILPSKYHISRQRKSSSQRRQGPQRRPCAGWPLAPCCVPGDPLSRCN